MLFPISNLSKWKMQSLFEAMQSLAHYEPLMALTIIDIENDLSREGKRERLQQMREHFTGKGMGCVDAYDLENDCAIPFDRFAPDIVFNQQPWRIAAVQHPKSVSRYALTCYVPYYVENYGILDMACASVFHRMLWVYFCQNEMWAKEFRRYQGRIRRAGKIVASGHPMLDLFSKCVGSPEQSGCVIYAPHWSCHVGECFSTFLETGEMVLRLAKAHPEIKWVFKPHPTLRHTLIEEGFWSTEKVDSYYSEWAEIGVVCTSGDYISLFSSSRAMITDCASFLVEYACTGKPIVHLVPEKIKYPPHPISAGLFASYYQVRSAEELKVAFEKIILRGEDPKKELRLAKVREMNLCNSNAARNIVEYLDGVLGEVNA